MRLQARPDIWRTYWYFAAERLAILERRQAGDMGPWSEDPIFRTYKFCNTFRATDRVSQYLIRNVSYGDADAAPQEIVFRTVLFRLFSKERTWEALVAFFGHAPVIEDIPNLAEPLTNAMKLGAIYTSAFILCANNAFGHERKHENHIALLKQMFLRDRLADKILEAKSLKAVFDLLKSYPLIGDFMAYQIAIDLNYSDVLAFSENDFTAAGPGALRGIQKVFLYRDEVKPEHVVMHMVENQEKAFAEQGLTFKGLKGRPLQAIDCQGLFCEVDKYCRVAHPQLTSNRTQIKSKFAPDVRPLPLFLPPKWGLVGV